MNRQFKFKEEARPYSQQIPLKDQIQQKMHSHALFVYLTPDLSYCCMPESSIVVHKLETYKWATLLHVVICSCATMNMGTKCA